MPDQVNSRDVVARGVTIRAKSRRDEDRSVEACLATDARVRAFDLRAWEPVEEVLLMRGFVPPPADQVPLYDSHPQKYGPPAAADVMGAVRQIRVNGGELIGRLYFDEGDPTADKLWGKVTRGFLTDVSVGAIPLETIKVEPGQVAVVEGEQYAAGEDRPLYIRTRWTIAEVSVTPVGADPAAKIRESVLEDRGMPKRKAGDEQEQAAAVAGDDTPVETVRQGTEQAASPGDGAAGAQASTPPTPPAPPGDEATLRAAEADRLATLRQIAADNPAQAELVGQAIREGWPIERAAREVLTAVRAARSPAVDGRGPAVHSRDPEAERSIPVLGAALMLRTGLALDSPVFSGPAARGMRFADHSPWLLRGVNDPQRQQVMDLAHRYYGLSLVDVCREAVRLDAQAGRASARAVNPLDTDAVIREAVSGGALSAIFTTNVNAAILAGYAEAADTTVGWVSEEEVPNFQTREIASMGKMGALKRLARGGTAEHLDVGDSYESYKIARYAGKFVVDEQDIIDDRFGGIESQTPMEIGNSARALRPDLVYALLLANPSLTADSTAVFHTASHGNLASNALADTAIQTGITAMGKQRIRTRPLNLRPRYLLVPKDLEFTADIILTSGERRADQTSAVTTGIRNPLSGRGISIVSDDRMGVAGVTDPATETAYAGSATNWWLMAAPGEGGARTIVVGYRRGTGRAPQIRSFQLDRGQWGIGWDVNLDIGGKWLDYRGAYQGNT